MADVLGQQNVPWGFRSDIRSTNISSNIDDDAPDFTITSRSIETNISRIHDYYVRTIATKELARSFSIYSHFVPQLPECYHSADWQSDFFVTRTEHPSKAVWAMAMERLLAPILIEAIASRQSEMVQ